MEETILEYGDLVEENDKTIRENNLEIKHNIPIGSLVEVKFSEWHGNGACQITHARWWVVSHTRDCDGTPLYSITSEKSALTDPAVQTDILRKLIYGVKHGFAENRLKLVKITSGLLRGEDALAWDE